MKSFDELSPGMVFVVKKSFEIRQDTIYEIVEGTQFTLLDLLENKYDDTESGQSVYIKSQHIKGHAKCELQCSYKFLCENFEMVSDAIGINTFKCEYVKCRKDKHGVFHVEFKDVDNKVYKMSGDSDNPLVKKALYYMFECDVAEEFEWKMTNVEIDLPIVEAP